MRLRRESIADKIEDSLKHSRFREGSLLADTVVPQTAGLRLLLLCSMAYFSSDRFPEAEEFLKRAKRLDDTYPALNEFEAFIKLKSAASREEAAVAYLSLIDSVPGVRRYRRDLKKIRTARDFASFQKKAKLSVYVRPAEPPAQKKKGPRRSFGFSFPKLRFVIPLVLLAAGAGIGVWLSAGRAVSPPSAPESGELSYIDAITIENEKYPLLDRVSKEKTALFFYDETQVKELFDRAKREMKQGNWNRAILSVNSILLSNANLSVKERASFLRKFIPSPDRIPPMTVDPAELFANRNLYEGAVLTFTGKAANVEQSGGKTSFSLLLNFREKPRFDGVIEVYCESRVLVGNGDSVAMSGVMTRPAGGMSRPYVLAVKVERCGE